MGRVWVWRLEDRDYRVNAEEEEVCAVISLSPQSMAI